jgi:hypothetical protein
MVFSATPHTIFLSFERSMTTPCRAGRYQNHVEAGALTGPWTLGQGDSSRGTVKGDRGMRFSATPCYGALPSRFLVEVWPGAHRSTIRELRPKPRRRPDEIHRMHACRFRNAQ